MVSKGSPSRTHGFLFPDPTSYRQLVSALQYLTLTRPNIAYAMQHVSQFMSALTNVYFEVVKHILRYLKGTLGHGLPLRRFPASTLLVA